MEGAGASSPQSGNGDVRLHPEAAGRQGSALIDASCNSQVSASEKSSGQSWRAGTGTRRHTAVAPSQMFTYPTHGRAVPGALRALGGDRASASRGQVRSQVLCSARAAAPPPRQRPAQSSGSSWRTGRPSAALGAPPPAAVAAAAAPAARASRVRAPPGPAGGRRGALCSRRAHCGPHASIGGWGTQSGGRRGGAELGGGHRWGRPPPSRPPQGTIQSAAACQQELDLPEVRRRLKRARHCTVPAPGPSSEPPGLPPLLGAALVSEGAVSEASALGRARPAGERAGARRLPRCARPRAGELAAVSPQPSQVRVWCSGPGLAAKPASTSNPTFCRARPETLSKLACTVGMHSKSAWSTLIFKRTHPFCISLSQNIQEYVSGCFSLKHL